MLTAQDLGKASRAHVPGLRLFVSRRERAYCLSLPVTATHSTSTIAVLLCVIASACGRINYDVAKARDAGRDGPIDANSRDTEVTSDAATTSADALESSAADGGASEGAVSDGGVLDAGVFSESGPQDSSRLDGTVSDATMDARTPDAQPLDGASDSPPDAGGCPAACNWGCLSDRTTCDTVIDIAVGQQHSCAVVASGTVYCWGGNTYGQLGDGTLAARFVPTPVALIGDAIDVEAGAHFTCVRRRIGGIYCWGLNTKSELGLPATPFEVTATLPVANVPDAIAVALGEEHGCAVLAAPNAGEVRCWGNSATASAVDVPGIAGAIALAATDTRTYALLSDGRVFDWSTFIGVTGPVQLTETGVAGISADNRGWCFSMLDGSVRCSGADSYGRRGDDAVVNPPSSSSAVVSITTATGKIASGASTGCAEDASGWACWGRLIGRGRIPLEGYLRPDRFPLSGISQFAFSSHTGGHACARDANRVLCFGDDTYGQLGRGDSLVSKVPRAIGDFGAGYSRLFLGYEGFCASRTDGTVRCTGTDAVGLDTTDTLLTPTDTGRVGFLDGALSSGGGVGLSSTGVVTEWSGRSSGGFIAPSAVAGIGPASSIALESRRSCATETAPPQNLYCWDRGSAPALAGVDAASAVQLGIQHTCVIRTGQVWCAGMNSRGQLGTVGPDRATFDTVPGISLATALSSTSFSNCVVHDGGLVSCWGYLKTSPTAWTTFFNPTPVAGLGSSAVQIESARDTTCIINNLSELWCWGQLPGDGLDFSSSPVRVAASAIAMAGGAQAFCYLPDVASAPRCWGTINPDIFGRIESDRYLATEIPPLTR